MSLRIRVSGADILRNRMNALSELAATDRFVRKGMSNAARIVSTAQKNLAPIRKPRIQQRELDRRLRNGMDIGKATRLSAKVVPKYRSIGLVKTSQGYVRPDGPLRLIPPGLLRRSIGFRVKREKGTNFYAVVIGANVGKKKKNPNNAPHSAIVGSGTKERFSNKFSKNTIGPLRVSRGVMPSNSYISKGLRFAAPAALRALEAGVHAEIAVEANR